MRHSYAALLSTLAKGVCLASLSVPARARSADEVELGNRLAAVLRAGRSVVSNNQELINDPAAGDKNLTGNAFQRLVIEAYLA
ncbi:MAG: hypothetical protein WBB85_03565, partial [Albidovulum sp.]|uniref:hypothetical protein n=1 Tax=Albidovulum sp. TaxID=1872424 RepID=UPI003C88610D